MKKLLLFLMMLMLPFALADTGGDLAAIAVAHYGFENTTDDDINGYNVEATGGSVLYNTGIIGNAYENDATNCLWYGLPPYTTQDDGGFSLWLQLYDLSDAEIFGLHDAGGDYLNFFMYNPNQLAVYGYSPSNSKQFFPYTSPDAAKWYHIVYTSNQSGHDLFVNGTKITSYSLGNDTQNMFFGLLGSPVNFTFGCQDVSGGSSGFELNGLIDEVVIFNSTDRLTQSQVDFLFNSGAGCEYPFNDCGVLSVSLLSPADHTTSASKLNVSYDVSALSNCSIYIEGAVNQTANNVNGVNNFFISDMNNDGTYHYYIYCDNPDGNATSEERHYHFHADSPLIEVFQPNHDDMTAFFNVTSIEIIGNITNGNLTEVNETIRNSTTILFDNDSSLLPTGTTFLDLYKVLDVSAWGIGNFYYDIYAIDEALNPSIENITFTITECLPSWECTQYAACNTSNLHACNSTIDMNYCGVPYTGDFSEFSPVGCDYCIPNLLLVTDFATCTFDTTFSQDVRVREYNYTNYAACCGATGLNEDCNSSLNFIGELNVTETYIGSWAVYKPLFPCGAFEYSASDAAPAVIDGLVKIVIAIASFAALIGFLLFAGWVGNLIMKR